MIPGLVWPFGVLRAYLVLFGCMILGLHELIQYTLSLVTGDQDPSARGTPRPQLSPGLCPLPPSRSRESLPPLAPHHPHSRSHRARAAPPRRRAGLQPPSQHPRSARAGQPTKADATSCIDRGVFSAASFDRVLLDPPCSALGLRPSLRVGGVSAWSDAKATRVSAEARPYPRPRPLQTGRTSLPAPYETVFPLGFVASWLHRP